jgi:hypothetical protein
MRYQISTLRFAISNLHIYFEIKTKHKLDINEKETVSKHKETTNMIKKK